MTKINPSFIECPKCRIGGIILNIQQTNGGICIAKPTCEHCKTEFTSIAHCYLYDKKQMAEYCESMFKENQMFEITKYKTRAFYKPL